MALDNAQFISELSITDPPGTDPLSEGDDQIRTTKRATQQSFPNIDEAVTKTAAQLNDVAQLSEANVFTALQTIVDNNLRFSAASTFLTGIQWEDSAGAVREWELLDDRTSGSDLVIRRYVGGVLQATALRVVNVNGVMELGFGTGVRLATGGGGTAELRSDGNTDTELRRLDFGHQDATLRATVGHDASSVFQVKNLINGGPVELAATDTGATLRNFLINDPDGDLTLRGVDAIQLEFPGSVIGVRTVAGGNTNLHNNGILRFHTGFSGTCAIRSDGNTDAEAHTLQWLRSNGSNKTNLGFADNSANFIAENLIVGGSLTLRVLAAGSVSKTAFVAAPDSRTTVRGNTDLQLEVGASEVALRAVANSQVQLFFDNNVRFVTLGFGDVEIRSVGSTDTENRRLFFSHQNSTLRGLLGHDSVGTMDLQNRINGGILGISAFNGSGGTEFGFVLDPTARVTVGSTALPLRTQGSTIGFFGSDGTAKPTITGAKGANEALTSLIPALAAMGLIVDNTTL